MCADCNLDGQVTTLDALLAQQIANGVVMVPPAQAQFCDVTPPFPAACGVDPATITSLDAQLIAQFVVTGAPTLQCCFMQPLCGDCDGDGDVDILDALAAAFRAVGLAPIVATDCSCDVVVPRMLACDGTEIPLVTLADALQIALFALGVPVSLSCA